MGRLLLAGRMGLFGTAFLITVALCLVSFLAGAAPAFAHAELVRSDPPENAQIDSSPSELRLWFSEAPEPVFSQVKLLDSSGRPVQTVGELRTDPADATLLHASLGVLVPGIYTVSWRVTSADDGHVSTGAFAFAVGGAQLQEVAAKPAAAAVSSGEEPPTSGDVVIRWLGYLGMSLLMGGFALAMIARRQLTSRELPASAERAGEQVDGWKTPKANENEGIIDMPQLVAILTIGWSLTFVSTLVGAVAQAATGAQVDLLAAFGAPLEKLLDGTRYGALFWMRLLFLEALVVLLVLGHRALRSGRGRAVVLGGVALTALVLLTESLGSHAASDSYFALSIVVDWLHLSAAATWVGGLVALIVTLPVMLRSGTANANMSPVRLVSGFSLIATICVGVIVLTGTLRALSELGGWDDLLYTSYGTTLLIKLGLLVPLLGLAFVNRTFILPRLNKASRDHTPPAGMTSKALLGTVGGETALALAVLLVTSVLASSPTPGGAYGSGLVLRAQSGAINAEVIVDPARPGLNSFDIYLRGQSRQPVTDVEKVALIFSAEEQDTGQVEAVARDQGGGHYLVDGSYVSFVGTWHLQLLIRQSGKEDVRLDLQIQPYQLADHSASGHTHH